MTRFMRLLDENGGNSSHDVCVIKRSGEIPAGGLTVTLVLVPSSSASIAIIEIINYYTNYDHCVLIYSTK